MTERPLVSIVTPSLNQGQFIRATIESVLSQDYPNIEYIVVDGGSTDDTLSILKSFGERVRWVSEKDGGQSEAVNKGWRMARGEILSWLNADDLLAPGAVTAAALALEAADVAGLYGDCEYIDEAGRHLGDYPSQPFDYDKLVTLTEDFIPQPGTFLRSSSAREAGLLDESLHFVMDYDFWLRLGMRAPMKYLPQKMAFARLHGGAKTHLSTPRFGAEMALIFTRLVERPDFPERLAKQKRTILANAFVHAASLCFWGGEIRQARYFLARAWKQTPFIRSRSFWRLLVFSLAGKPGWRLAERLHGNPFRLERGALR